MKNKIISTLAGILLAGSVAGCTVNPNATFWPTGPPPAGSGGWGLRTFAANGEALNGKPLTPEAKQHILNGADYLDNAERQQEIKNYQKREHNFQREMQKDEHTFQRGMRDESRNNSWEKKEFNSGEQDFSSLREKIRKKNDFPIKDFYTSVWKDLNQDNQIRGDEIFEKKNIFYYNENVCVNMFDHLSSPGTNVQIIVYGPTGKVVERENYNYTIKSPSDLGFNLIIGFSRDSLIESGGFGKYNVKRINNGFIDGDIEFHVLSNNKSYL